MTLTSGIVSAVHGCKIYYEVYTPSKNPNPNVLVFQHGYTGSTFTWTYTLPYFWKNNYQCILIDGRGCGKSGANGNFNINQYTEDIISVVNHLKIGKFSYIGHSMGGGIGFNLGSGPHASRLNSLVLVTPIPSTGIVDPLGGHEIARKERKTLSLEAYAEVKKAGLYRQEYVNADPKGWLAATQLDLACGDEYYDGSWDTMTKFNVETQLKNISVSTLMVVGACDGLAAANIKDFGSLPNASLHVFSRVGHNPNREVPQEFAEAVIDFLENGTSNVALLMANVVKARKQLAKL